MGTYWGWLTKIAAVGTLSAAILVCVQIAAHADTTSPWVSGTPGYAQLSTLEIKNTADLDAFTLLKNYRMPCAKEDFTTRPKRTNQTAITKTVCSSSVLSGRVANNLLLKNGTSVAGTVVGSTNTNSIVKTIPSSDTVIELTSAQQIGYYVWPLEHAYTRATNVTDAAGQVTYKIPAASAGSYIKNANNVAVLADPNTINFSDNGEWMIADAPGTGFVRINLASKQVLPFAASLSGANNISVPSINAISGDGRYAVISSSNNPQMFSIYDLATCTPPTNGGLVYNCQKRDLNTIMAGNVATWRKVIGNMRFASNNTLYFYGSYDFVSGLNQKYGLFSLTTPGAVTSKLDYLALGDSFSSGEGAYSYWTATDSSNNKCHLSTKSYPFVLYETVGSVGSFKSVACSGAKTMDINTIGQDSYNKDNSQSKNKIGDEYDSEIYTNYLPGYRVQNNFVADNKPKIITMSIGGNDVGFSSILKKCILSIGDCYSTYEESYRLVSSINNAYDPLLDTYKKVKESSAPDTKIYIVGYPQIAQANGNCAINVHFNNNEILFGQQLIKHLNMVIKTAAEHAGVFYVDVENAFDGHKLCEIKAKDAAVHGLIVSNDIERVKNLALSATESYHPTALGHELLANAIANATNNFNAPMPSASLLPVNFGDITINPLVFGKPSDGTQASDVAYGAGMAADTLLQNTSSGIFVSTYDYSLSSNTNFDLVMYSTPTSLGTIKTDEFGNINGTFTVPGSISPGYHTLHVRGVNVQNEPVDIMKLVYVAATADDFDGDGTPNTNETCLLVEPANIDYDQDGIDDACDGAIGEPPEIILPPVVDEPPADEPTDPELPPVDTNQSFSKDAVASAGAEQTPKESKTTVTQTSTTTTPPASTSNTSSQTIAPEVATEQNTPVSDNSTQVAGVSTQAAKQPAVAATVHKNNAWLFIAPMALLLFILTGFTIYVKVSE